MAICSVDACEKFTVAKGMCNQHYKKFRKYGDPLYGKSKINPSKDAGPCLVCGNTSRDGWYQGSQYCSYVCKDEAWYHDGKRPDSKPCVRCGEEINLNARTASGWRRVRVKTSLCNRCERKKLPANIKTMIAERDGTDCRLCDKPIDLSLAYPNLMSASVDHIIPWSQGGSDEITNLQLAHFMCNSLRGNKNINKELVTSGD